MLQSCQRLNIGWNALPCLRSNLLKFPSKVISFESHCAFFSTILTVSFCKPHALNPIFATPAWVTHMMHLYISSAFPHLHSSKRCSTASRSQHSEKALAAKVAEATPALPPAAPSTKASISEMSTLATRIDQRCNWVRRTRDVGQAMFQAMPLCNHSEKVAFSVSALQLAFITAAKGALEQRYGQEMHATNMKRNGTATLSATCKATTTSKKHIETAKQLKELANRRNKHHRLSCNNDSTHGQWHVRPETQLWLAVSQPEP